jgi:hypothetical protein
MKKRYIFIILGAVGIICLVAWFSILTTVVQNLLASRESKDPVAVDLTLCDEDASGLCIVTFGADNQNLMVIHFQLPNEDYPAFYVKATNRGTTNMYSCEVDKVEAVDKTRVDKAETDETKVIGTAPNRAYCTGVRTPLGETIDIEVYTIDKDKLIARGTFLVSAIAVVTPISQPTSTLSGEETPIFVPSPTEDIVPTFSEFTPSPTQGELTPTPTPTLDTGYPNE